MKLTETEEKLVAQLRRRKRLWPLNMRASLICGPILVVGAVVMYQMFRHLVAKYPDTFPVAAPFFVPMFLFFCAGIGYFFGFAIRNRNGNAETDLLLKLIDEHKESNSQQDN